MNTSTAYFERLGAAFEICGKIVERYPGYTYDFQVLIDERDGTVYHYDFDRTFERKPFPGMVANFYKFQERVRNLTTWATKGKDGQVSLGPPNGGTSIMEPP